MTSFLEYRPRAGARAKHPVHGEVLVVGVAPGRPPTTGPDRRSCVLRLADGSHIEDERRVLMPLDVDMATRRRKAKREAQREEPGRVTRPLPALAPGVFYPPVDVEDGEDFHTADWLGGQPPCEWFDAHWEDGEGNLPMNEGVLVPRAYPGARYVAGLEAKSP